MAPFDSSLLLAEEPAPLADLLPEASSPPTTKPSSSSSRVPAPRHPLLAAASPPDSRAGPAPKESSSSSLRSSGQVPRANSPRPRQLAIRSLETSSPASLAGEPPRPDPAALLCFSWPSPSPPSSNLSLSPALYREPQGHRIWVPRRRPARFRPPVPLPRPDQSDPASCSPPPPASAACSCLALGTSRALPR